jgi:hypothetical protein
MRIIAAGLRGGGSDASADDVAQMQAEGGAAGFVDIVSRLLGATFGSATPAGPAHVPGKQTASPAKTA